ncbi:hypothetical protein HYH03_002204 [Edaphochlamys debaryana]|uniref:5'-nucleotidase n=1 Tax=Edaphochlamys debaryana TaxID=47281 RepID=A0A836C5P5_9CHLO|nr:hypothetical protein HYH03_002204 [Edaphochlamys debaryana]|eukprot:KAG2499917.1 hypothetical protein HYH03_002204 [Edaphochlamys debaryana]
MAELGKRAREDGAEDEGRAVRTASSAARELVVLHFNDVYSIEAAMREPVGGAARLASKVKEFRDRGQNPLVLFSGDAYNPSLMSTMTLGAQMVPVLNEIGVNVACIGNHDFDWGVDNLVKLNSQCNFPWLMANVLQKDSDLPFASAQATWLHDWGGIKVGIVGLAEEDWLTTLGTVEPEDVAYVDFVEMGRRKARELKAQGAEVLIALTHMREPNDRKLAAEVPEFHLILGGHDHQYVSAFIEPHNNLLVKSGTEFRDLSAIRVALSGPGTDPALSVERITIDSAVPEDPATLEIVNQFMKLMGEKMDEEVGETLEDLDGRFQVVRNRESNLGNFVTDVWRKAASADIAILNSGSLRSDTIHPAGKLKARDWVAILPMLDETCVLECSGAQVVAALENAVSQWPKLEGRFPQVSGLKFTFDPAQPPGHRVVPGSLVVTDVGGREGPEGEEPLEAERLYKVAVKEYLAQGHDGFDCLEGCKVLVVAENAPLLPTAIKRHFIMLEVLAKWKPGGTLHSLTRLWRHRSKQQLKDAEEDGSPPPAPAGGPHGIAVFDPTRGYCISPVVEGRIVIVGHEEPAAAVAPA